MKEGFPCTLMIRAVKEEMGCCFDILTESTYKGYTVLKVVSEFVIT